MQNPLAHLDLDPSKKEFTVVVSGHGSNLRYNGGSDPRTPPPADLWVAYDEACREAQSWIVTSDTIGGEAVVVHVPTSRLVPSGQEFKCVFGLPEGRGHLQEMMGVG